MSEAELSCGVHALIVRRAGVPLVEVRVVLPLSAAQIAHSAETLVLSESVLSGTAAHDRAGLADAVGRIGGTLGASVSGDAVVIHASALAGRLPDILSLLAEVLTSATYPAHEVEGDRARTADQVTIALSQPETVATEAISKRLFGRHPYGAEMPRPGAIRRVRASRLRRLHSSLVQPRSAHLVLVGDLEPRRAITMAEAAMSGWPQDAANHTARALMAPAAVQSGPLLFLDSPGSVQSNLRIGGAMAQRGDEDWPAAALANAIFGGMFTSRLVENLRERNGYTYSPSSSVRHFRVASAMTIGADVSTAVTAAALVETRYELGRLVVGGVTDDELEAARRYLVGTFLLETATQSGLASTLAALVASGAGPDYLWSHPERIAKTAKSAVDEAARRYWAPSALATVIVGDAESVTGQLSVLDDLTIG
ncbi:MAG TPA: pitrilysin family protein [Acidimicrobiales bacterium]|nr:pitrilysin family protein [Acidimicrobiales bacterium]